MASHQDLPKTHRALVLTSTKDPPTVETKPTPQPTPGSIVVRIIVANILPYQREIYTGIRPYPFPTPMVTGNSAIARVVAVGPDATIFTPGQLVLFDVFIRCRDDPSAAFLSGIHQGYSEGTKKLMHGEWRDSTYAEYAKLPLEDCFPLNEKRLLGKVEDGGLGYTIEDLAYVSRLLVPFGGLRDMKVMAGETIIVAPATGSYGQAAVSAAEAMGARVIAAGRNLDALKRIASQSVRIEYVQLKGDVQTDAAALRQFGDVDGYLDISPPAAAKSTHIKSCILAVKRRGRISLMGGIGEDIPFPYSAFMHSSLTMYGTWMFDRDATLALIKLVETGTLKLGETAGMTTVGKFALEDWDKAFTAALDTPGIQSQALLAP